MRFYELQLASASFFRGNLYVEKTPEPARINSQQTSDAEHIKAMKEALRVAAEIRRELAGRAHSDSTDLAADES